MAVYDTRFFAQNKDRSYESALAILPLLLEITGARSIVDVGCGSGAWLAAARELGVSDLLGIDGSYVQPEMLLIPGEQFHAMDLAKPFGLNQKFDLMLSLEVAEHLPPARGESFVEDLVRLGAMVAFSAAIPGQGGLEHVNEQWQDYWHTLFAKAGYRAIDAVRPAVWDRADVAPWYAQNTFLFASREEVLDIEPATLPTRLVHPEIFTFRLTTPTLHEVLSHVIPSTGDSIRWRMDRLLHRD